MRLVSCNVTGQDELLGQSRESLEDWNQQHTVSVSPGPGSCCSLRSQAELGQPLLHSEFEISLSERLREAEVTEQAKQVVRRRGPPWSGSWLWEASQKVSLLPVLVLQFCNELSLLFVGIKVEAGISGRTSLR